LVPVLSYFEYEKWKQIANNNAGCTLVSYVKYCSRVRRVFHLSNLHHIRVVCWFLYRFIL